MEQPARTQELESELDDRSYGSGNLVVMMHPTAKKCTVWAVVLFVIGAVSYFGAPWFFTDIQGNGADAVITARASEFVLFLGQWCATAIGAALVGAAVVIQTLAGGTPSDAVS